MHELNAEIGKLLAKAEQLGAEGNVDESQKILMEVEKVRAKKKEAEVGCWLFLRHGTWLSWNLVCRLSLNFKSLKIFLLLLSRCWD